MESNKTFRNGMPITDECSILIQSFANKIKVSSERGLQFKPVPKKDEVKEFLKQYASESFEKFMGMISKIGGNMESRSQQEF